MYSVEGRKAAKRITKWYLSGIDEEKKGGRFHRSVASNAQTWCFIHVKICILNRIEKNNRGEHFKQEWKKHKYSFDSIYCWANTIFECILWWWIILYIDSIDSQRNLLNFVYAASDDRVIFPSLFLSCLSFSLMVFHLWNRITKKQIFSSLRIFIFPLFCCCLRLKFFSLLLHRT